MKVVVIGIEVEEGLEATCRQPAPLDEGLVDVDARFELDAAVRRVGVHATIAREAAIRVDAAAVTDAEALAHRGARTIPSARAATDVELHEGAQEAPIGRGASIQIDAAEHIRAVGRVGVSARLIPFDIELDLAADLEAGVGAGDVEEARTINATDPDVIDRSRLPGRKIGSLCPGNRDETGGRSEEKALGELH